MLRISLRPPTAPPVILHTGHRWLQANSESAFNACSQRQHNLADLPLQLAGVSSHKMLQEMTALPQAAVHLEQQHSQQPRLWVMHVCACPQQCLTTTSQ